MTFIHKCVVTPCCDNELQINFNLTCSVRTLTELVWLVLVSSLLVCWLTDWSWSWLTGWLIDDWALQWTGLFISWQEAESCRWTPLGDWNVVICLGAWLIGCLAHHCCNWLSSWLGGGASGSLSDRWRLVMHSGDPHQLVKSEISVHHQDVTH